METFFIGGSEEKRHYTNLVARDAAKYLLGSRMLKALEVTFVFKRNIGGDGFVSWEDDNHRPREFEMLLDSSLDLYRTLLTVCHEMVHVKQFIHGELKDMFQGGYRQVWKGKEYSGMSHKQLPWEAEAYDLEEEVLKHCLERCGLKDV